jgi:hypothetical protein
LGVASVNRAQPSLGITTVQRVAPTPTARAVVNAINAQVAAQAASVRASMASYNDTLSQLMTIKESVTSAKAALSEMKSLASQGASGSLDERLSRNLYERIEELRSDVNAIAATTTFNGQRLLDGSKSRKTITTIETIKNVASASAPAAQSATDTSKAPITFNSVPGQRIEGAESLRSTSGVGNSEEDILESTGLTASSTTSSLTQGSITSASGNGAITITGSAVAPVVPVAGYSILSGISSMKAAQGNKTADSISGVVNPQSGSATTFTFSPSRDLAYRTEIVTEFNNASSLGAWGVTASEQSDGIKFTANALSSDVQQVIASIGTPKVTASNVSTDDPVTGASPAAGYSTLTGNDNRGTSLLLEVGGTIKFKLDNGIEKQFTSSVKNKALNEIVTNFNTAAIANNWLVTMSSLGGGSTDASLRISANDPASEVTTSQLTTAQVGGVTTFGAQTPKVTGPRAGSTTIYGLSSLAATDSLTIEILDKAASGVGKNAPNVIQPITLSGTALPNLSAIAAAVQSASNGLLTASVSSGELILTATNLTNDVRFGSVAWGAGGTTYAGVATAAVAEVKGSSSLSDGSNALNELQKGGTITVTVGGTPTTYTATQTRDQSQIVTDLAAQLGTTAGVSLVNNVIKVTATATGMSVSSQVTNPSYVDLNLGTNQSLYKGDQISFTQGGATQTLTISGDRLTEADIRSEIEALLGNNATVAVTSNALGTGVRLVSNSTDITSTSTKKSPQVDFSLGADLKRGDQIILNYSDSTSQKLVASQSISSADLLSRLSSPSNYFTDFSTNAAPVLDSIQVLHSQGGSALIRSTDPTKTLNSITTARVSEARFSNATSEVYHGHLHEGDHLVLTLAGQSEDLILTAKGFTSLSDLALRINDPDYFTSTNPAIPLSTYLDSATLVVQSQDASLGYSISKAQIHDFDTRHFVDLDLTSLSTQDQLSVGDRVKVKQNEINVLGQIIASTEETLIVDTAISKADVVNAFRGNAPGNGKSTYFLGTGANAAAHVAPTLATSHSGEVDGRLFAKQSLSTSGNRLEIEATINEKGKSRIAGINAASDTDLVVLNVGATTDAALYNASTFSSRLSGLGASFDALNETVVANAYDTAIDGYLQKPGSARKSSVDLFDDTGLIRAGTRLSVTYTKTLGGSETKEFDLTQDAASLNEVFALGLSQAIQPTAVVGQDLSVSALNSGNELQVAASTGFISDIAIGVQSPTKATLGSFGDLQKGDRLTVNRAGVVKTFEATGTVFASDLASELNASTPSGKFIDPASNASSSLFTSFNNGLKAGGSTNLVIAETALGSSVSATLTKSPFADFSLTSAKAGDTFSVSVGGATQSFTVLSDLGSVVDIAAALNGTNSGALSGSLQGASASVTSGGLLRIKSHSVGSSVAAERVSTKTTTVTIDGDDSQNQVTRLLSPTTFSDISIKSATNATGNTDSDAQIVGEVYDSLETLKASTVPSREAFARLEVALDSQLESLDRRIRGAELQAAAVQNLARFELASLRDSLGGGSTILATPDSAQPLRILMLQNVSQSVASQGNASRNMTLLLIEGLSSSFGSSTSATRGILAIGTTGNATSTRNNLIGSAGISGLTS